MSPIVVIVVVTIVLVLVIFALSGVRVVQQYERGVIFILGLERRTGARLVLGAAHYYPHGQG